MTKKQLLYICLISILILLNATIGTTEVIQTKPFTEVFPVLHRHYINKEKANLVLFDANVDVLDENVVILQTTDTWMHFLFDHKVMYLMMCVEQLRRTHGFDGYYKTLVRYENRVVYSMEYDPEARFNYLFKDMTDPDYTEYVNIN